jgi:hypothetical protein
MAGSEVVKDISLKSGDFLMRNVKALSLLAVCVMGVSMTGSAIAQTQYLISGPATTWMIQDYVPQNVVLWDTGSSCTNGQIVFPSTAVQADKDMLLAVIATSKATGAPLNLYYTVSSGTCYIASFALSPQ